MTKKHNTEHAPMPHLGKDKLREAITVLCGEWERSAERAKALVALREFGMRARPALLLVLACLNDPEEATRFQAIQTFGNLCPGAFHRMPHAAAALSSWDEKERLATIREMVRILPEVQAARAAGAPGWRALREFLREGETPLAKEERMPAPSKTESGTEGPKEEPDGVGWQGDQGLPTVKAASPLTLPKGPAPSALEEVLPTGRRAPDDPVVRAMRANPGRWIAWNEATGEVFAISDDYNAALDGLVNPDDPNTRIDLAPGFHANAAIHRPVELLDWESPNVLDDVWLLWGESADAWLDLPNPQFGHRAPRQLVGTEEERLLRDVLRAVRDGMPS